MRRILLVGITVFLASVMSVSLSFVAVSEARSESSASKDLEKLKKKLEGVEDRVLNESPKNPYHQVVDNSNARNFEAKGYQKRQAAEEAFGEGYAVATEKAGPVSFEMKVPQTRYYSVWARWPASGENAEEARLGIPSTDGMEWEEVDQSEDGGMWVRIGAYEMQKGQRDIQLQSGGGRAVADAVIIVGDALVGKDGRTASVADPYDFAADAEDQSSGVSEALSSSLTTTSAGEPSGADVFASMTASASRPTGRDVVRMAKRHLGTRYAYSPCRYKVREDCSCHTRLVFSRFGHRLPDSPVYQWRMNKGNKFRTRSLLRPGDLVFHDLNRDRRLDDHYTDHVSIWAGRGNIVHASSYFGKVVVSEERYLPGYWGAKRFGLRWTSTA